MPRTPRSLEDCAAEFRGVLIEKLGSTWHGEFIHPNLTVFIQAETVYALTELLNDALHNEGCPCCGCLDDLVQNKHGWAYCPRCKSV